MSGKRVGRGQAWLVLLVLLGLLGVSGGAAMAETPTIHGAPAGAQRVMVEFKPGRAAGVRAALERAGGAVHYQFDDLNTIAVTLPEAALSGIARNPNVLSVTEDVKRYPMGQATPWGITAVQAPEAWGAGVTGAGVKVCVIDSGVYRGHADIPAANLAGGYPTGWDTDTCGHGTHVSGTILAANNDIGVVGVSPAVSLYMVKVFDGPDCGWAYSSTLVDATNRCVAAEAKIISMSLGGSKSSRTEKTQFANLYSQGFLSIAAAGNEGTSAYSYPASYDSVVSVAAIDSNNAVADFSQYNSQVELAAPGVGVLSTVPFISTNTLTVDGATYTGSQIEYAAHGTASGDLVNGGLCTAAGAWSGKVVLCERGDISFYDKVMNVQNSGGAAAVIYNNVPGGFLGTLGEGYSSTIPAISLSQEDGQYLVANKLGQSGTVVSTPPTVGSGYEAWDGTSMATPHVSAVAALLWSSNSSLTNAEIRSAMAATAKDLGAAGRDVYYGYGLVQAKAALDSLGGVAPNQPPTAGFTFTTADLTATFADTSTDSDGSVVAWSWDFGDGGTSTAQNPTHTYEAARTYTVSLTVTDDDGATGSISKPVTVTSGGTTGITLSVTTRKAGANKFADLVWSGATSANVDVYRTNTKVITTPNDGAYSDKVAKTTTMATYKVCEEGSTTVCSNEVTVTW